MRAMRNRLAYTQSHGYRLLWNAEQVDPKYPVSKQSNEATARSNSRTARAAAAISSLCSWYPTVAQISCTSR